MFYEVNLKLWKYLKWSVLDCKLIVWIAHSLSKKKQIPHGPPSCPNQNFLMQYAFYHNCPKIFKSVKKCLSQNAPVKKSITNNADRLLLLLVLRKMWYGQKSFSRRCDARLNIAMHWNQNVQSPRLIYLCAFS